MIVNASRLSDVRVKDSFLQKAKRVLSALEAEGFAPVIVCVIRTQAEQRRLYAQGRSDATLKNKGYSAAEIASARAAGNTAGKPIVTGVSVSKFHAAGLAMDIAFWDASSKKVIWDGSYKGYARYGALCKENGLVWGGGWKMKDLGHCQLGK